MASTAPTEPRVCPRCGTVATGGKFCDVCGLDLASQYEIPTRLQWESTQGGASPTDARSPAEAHSTSAIRSPEDIAGGVLVAVGALLVAVALVLPWFSFAGESASFWEITKVVDVTTTLVALGLIGLAIAALLSRALAVRITFVLVSIYLAPLIVESIEFMVTTEQAEAGPIMTIVGGIACLVGAGLVLAGDLRRGANEPGATGGPALHLTATIMGVAAGLIVTLALLLPTEGASSWETNKVGDIVTQLIALALAGVAFAAIFLPRSGLLMRITMLLAAYFGTYGIVTSIESLARKEYSAAIYLGLLASLMAVAVAVLLALRAYPRRD